MYIRAIVLSIVALTLSACVPSSPQDLRSDSSSAYSFTTNKDFDEVITILEDHFHQCYTSKVSGDGGKLSRETLADGSFAITYYSPGDPLMGDIYLIDVTVNKFSGNQTAVRVGYYSSWKTSAFAVQRWVKEDFPMCFSDSVTENNEDEIPKLSPTGFRIELPITEAHNFIANNLYYCHDAKATGGVRHVNSYLKPDLSQGIITASVMGFTGTDYGLYITLSPIGSSSTDVKIMYANHWQD